VAVIGLGCILPRWFGIAAVGLCARFLSWGWCCSRRRQNQRVPQLRAGANAVHQIENTVEYQMAKWSKPICTARACRAGKHLPLDEHVHGVPQVAGCCDQGCRHHAPHPVYTIYSDQNAGSAPPRKFSLAWLKLTPREPLEWGREEPRSFPPVPASHEIRWRSCANSGGNEDEVIYEVPQRSASLAHVIRPDDVVSRSPIHGLDTEPLARYVAALDDPALPIARMRWLRPHHARVDAELREGQLVSVQVSYGSRLARVGQRRSRGEFARTSWA